MEDSTIKALVAMGCITVLEGIALALGMDGAMLATVFILLGGIAGYELKAIRG